MEFLEGWHNSSSPPWRRFQSTGFFFVGVVFGSGAGERQAVLRKELEACSRRGNMRAAEQKKAGGKHCLLALPAVAYYYASSRKPETLEWAGN